tara:strand:+ start:9544 stop:10200 length:657 start_codon:yes stop_codon:yes gene_type:complete
MSIFKNNFRGVLFDLDGTVLDSEGLFDKAQAQYLKENDILVSKNDLSDFKGLSYKDFYPFFIKKFQLSESKDNIRHKIRTYLHKIMEKELRYICGFETFFKSYILNKGFKVGLVTNTTRATYNKVQSILNIDDYFQFVITATESKKPKPSPLPYLEAMESLCLDPKETLIIEDSKTGLISAVNSGAHVVGLKTSLSSRQMQYISKKIYAINHFKELTL